jgi:acetylornithine deacetylase/succinyl-diaminopimelate desuccinylase-like protein
MNPLEVENSNGFGVTMKYLNRRHTCKTDTGYEDTTIHSPAVSFLAGWLRGGRGPILWIAHLDVVDAPREGWLPGLDPFRLTEREGFFYGRGVLDVKNAVAGLVANLIRLRTEGFVPSRDIIVAFTADEETGVANGVSWLLANRRDWIDSAYCLNLDAGGGQIENGKRARLTVQTSQKTNQSFRAETKGPGGHSSQPVKNNAIYRLSAGLARLAERAGPSSMVLGDGTNDVQAAAPGQRHGISRRL